jgi:hypothetical protein
MLSDHNLFMLILTVYTFQGKLPYNLDVQTNKKKLTRIKYHSFVDDLH